MKNNFDEIIKECIEIIPCDTARISYLSGTMFLVIGFKRNTKEDKDTLAINEKGEVIHYDYFKEQLVTSGETKEQLLESLKEYQRISKLTGEEYFKELFQQK